MTKHAASRACTVGHSVPGRPACTRGILQFRNTRQKVESLPLPNYFLRARPAALRGTRSIRTRVSHPFDLLIKYSRRSSSNETTILETDLAKHILDSLKKRLLFETEGITLCRSEISRLEWLISWKIRRKSNRREFPHSSWPRPPISTFGESCDSKNTIHAKQPGVQTFPTREKTSDSIGQKSPAIAA